ncbi:MAG: hypothetical protein ABIX37_00285 [Gammaproteobacteria bacterium]
MASVLAFALGETASSEEFVALIKQGIDKDTSPDRFTTIDETIEYTDARGYPCVKYQGTAEDKKARIPLFKREPQKLQIYSLYCRHPTRPSLGFAIIFSHRGANLDPEVEQQGQDFISGVVVPLPVAPPNPNEGTGGN